MAAPKRTLTIEVDFKFKRSYKQREREAAWDKVEQTIRTELAKEDVGIELLTIRSRREGEDEWVEHVDTNGWYD